ncbi:MAG TPA: PTS transporter subunit EIIC [Candidatus Baltobacteraceae bacterium]
MVAVREALPWSLAGLAAGLIVFMALVPVHGPFFSNLLKRISLAELPAFGIMAVALVAILSYRLALRLRFSRPAVVAGSLLAFGLALPQPHARMQPLAYLHLVGESGLFLAIIAALSVVAACAVVRRFVHDVTAADTLAASAIVALAVALLAAHISIGNALIDALRPLGQLGDTYAALIAITIVETVLWTFGIHGPAALAAIVTPVYLTLQMQNTDAFSAHRPLPHIVVVSLFLFVFPGGAGATLPLAALLALSKVERLRKIGRLTIVPAMFNINEPLVFGLPLVLNPFLAIPFTLVPIVLATITYLAVAHGFVARPALYVPSSIPTFASTYLSTLDVRAVALVAVNVAVAAVIYLPFVRAYERHALRQAQDDTA